ncbi:hypothetical protein D3C72_430760 [compost metagenome]
MRPAVSKKNAEKYKHSDRLCLCAESCVLISISVGPAGQRVLANIGMRWKGIGKKTKYEPASSDAGVEQNGGFWQLGCLPFRYLSSILRQGPHDKQLVSPINIKTYNSLCNAGIGDFSSTRRHITHLGKNIDDEQKKTGAFVIIRQSFVI